MGQARQVASGLGWPLATRGRDAACEVGRVPLAGELVASDSASAGGASGARSLPINRSIASVRMSQSGLGWPSDCRAEISAAPRDVGLGWPRVRSSLRRERSVVSRETSDSVGEPQLSQMPASAGSVGRDEDQQVPGDDRSPGWPGAAEEPSVGEATLTGARAVAAGLRAADLRAAGIRAAGLRAAGPRAKEILPEQDVVPIGRTLRKAVGPMIAGTCEGARDSRVGESEDKVAIPLVPDASADTPIARAAQAAMNARAGGELWPRPRSCRILTIANQKGGVGKTTSAVNLAASLAMHGSRVLVVDLDPQGNASTALDVEHRSGTSSIYNVLVDGLPLADIVRKVAGFADLHCAPATIDLAGAEIELVPLVARESRLARSVGEYDSSSLDYIFIDCPPSLGLLTVNALVSAPEVLIPIQCEYYALEGLEQLLRTVELVRSHLNPGLVVSTILLTMFDSRTKLASQVADEVRSHFGDMVLDSVIPRSVRVSEAPSYGQSVMTYDPGSSGALAYLEAAREMAFKNASATTA